MALVIAPPIAIPNALNPTTAAVVRDAEKREITPAITPDNASAATRDSTADKDVVHYNPKKQDPEQKKKPNDDPSSPIDVDNANAVVFDHVNREGVTSAEDVGRVMLSIDMADPPEIIIAEVLLLRQAILARSTFAVHDRQQLAEINHIIKIALADLLRLKQVDEVKVLASQLPRVKGVLKGRGTDSHVIALDDLFAYSVTDNLNSASVRVSAKSKLAGAVIGYFYGENIEPQLPSQIDHQE